jgi:trimethylamine--corrinoid protein Co-methyltransferase
MKRRVKAGKSRSSGFSLHVMTDDEVHEIHLGTLEVLKDVGVFVENEEALERFGGGGCEVDPKSKVVKFPHWVIEEAIESAPRTYYACGRRPEDDVLLEDNRVTFTNFGEGIMFVDPHSGEHRETTKADIVKASRIIDYLENVETYERAMCSHDKPPESQALHNAEASLTNTTKHHWLCPVDRFQAKKITEMCAAIVGAETSLKKDPCSPLPPAPSAL